MRKFILPLLVALFTLPVSLVEGAQLVTTATASPANVQLLSAGATITRIQVLGGGSAATVAFYDSDDRTLTNASGVPTVVQPSFTEAISYTTNISVVITNTRGILQTNTITGVYTVNQAAGDTTNALSPVATELVAANGLKDTSVNITVSKGLIVNTTADATVAITYEVAQ